MSCPVQMPHPPHIPAPLLPQAMFCQDLAAHLLQPTFNAPGTDRYIIDQAGKPAGRIVRRTDTPGWFVWSDRLGVLRKVLSGSTPPRYFASPQDALSALAEALCKGTNLQEELLEPIEGGLPCGEG